MSFIFPPSFCSCALVPGSQLEGIRAPTAPTAPLHMKGRRSKGKCGEEDREQEARERKRGCAEMDGEKDEEQDQQLE